MSWLLNSFDVSILHLFNQFAHRSWTFDTLILLISGNYLIKGGVITGLVWWAWFHKGENKTQDREILLCGITTCILALIVSRVLANTLPFRERPLRNPALHFQIPYGMNEVALIGWSSFPSDHAAVFFALATSIFLVSRTAGILALCHTFFIICLTRIYLGIHYPSDIFCGAILGITIASLSRIAALKSFLARPGLGWLEKSPGTFYASFFLFTFQLATIFDPFRQVMRFVLSVMEAAFSRFH